MALMPISTFHEDVAAGKLAAWPIADANIHRILTLGQQTDRRPSAAIDEVAQIMGAEIRALAESGVFSLPGGNTVAAREPRQKKTRNQEKDSA
jgi:hypothetical protein